MSKALCVHRGCCWWAGTVGPGENKCYLSKEAYDPERTLTHDDDSGLAKACEVQSDHRRVLEYTR